MPRALRPYQSDAISGVRTALASHASCVVVLPTGTGKTSVAAALMNEWPGGNCLFLAHTRELVDQAAARLAGELGYPPVVEMGLRSGEQGLFYQGGMTVIGSVQSMVTDRRLAKYDRHPFDLIVVDEAHRATSRSYRKIVDHFTGKNPACKVVGLTATPNRADGTALGLVFEAVGYAMGIPDAIDGGWLVPVRQRSVVVSDVQITGPSRTNELGEKDYTDAAVESVMLDEQALVATADPLVREAAGRSSLVFCATVRHAHELAAVIDRYAPGSAAAVDGETPPDQRADLISKFRTGQIQFLCNAQLFVEGFDAPTCSCVAVARPTKSTGRYTQMVGRGLRPLPGVVDGPGDAQDRQLAIMTSDKPDCLVLDFVNAGASGLVTVDDVLGGNYDAEVREAAARERAATGDTAVGESLKRARFLLALEREMDARAGNRADVAYDVYDRDGRALASTPLTPRKRGTITDGQLAFLTSLGCNPDTAVAYSQKQAGSVIDSMRATRCTDKQRKVLARAGIDHTGIGTDRASRIIDALKANNWRRPEVLPA
ncbi:DEAD/DEAH box helicase [Gemmata sp.]|uniref:DEAD/DEAH box helicase n=1 Tax=Gemmata sp. TaxID=1914242 RepID=UPI003F70DD9B